MKSLTLPFDRRMVFAGVAVLALLTSRSPGDDFKVPWHTIDGGGIQNSAGGGFALSGTIGQPDAGPLAGPMTGGGFSLVGGFWPGIGSVCPLPGDMNGDGLRNGRDIQGFVKCLTGTGSCFCGDTDASGAVNTADIATFVSLLLA